jgi:hypothetical protein
MSKTTAIFLSLCLFTLAGAATAENMASGMKGGENMMKKDAMPADNMKAKSSHDGMGMNQDGAMSGKPMPDKKMDMKGADEKKMKGDMKKSSM